MNCLSKSIVLQYIMIWDGQQNAPFKKSKKLYILIVIKKFKKYLLIGGFSFFLIKGLIWLAILIAAFFGITKF
tara:strand:+ start:737 stop:955 length:219 start_codon:yes stop_codon:yes gene_type:complete